MIIGFEEETAVLSEAEMELLPGFVERLKLRIGKSNAVTNSQIRAGYERSKKIKIQPSRIRKIINYIRMNDLVPCLIATSDGYYVTEDKTELKKYVDSLIGRERAIRAIRQKIESKL